MQISDVNLYITSTEVHAVMGELRNKINKRKNAKFYRQSATIELLKTLKDSDQNCVKESAEKYLELCLIAQVVRL